MKLKKSQLFTATKSKEVFENYTVKTLIPTFCHAGMIILLNVVIKLAI